LADWTLEQQSDLEYQFNPEFEENLDHFWDFGDMNTSAEASPIHSYAETGVYTVTHIVSNACGADTLSSSVEVIITSTNSLQEAGLEIFPNPTKDYLTISSKANEISVLKMFSAFGQEIILDKKSGMLIKLNVSDFNPGVYWLNIQLNNGKTYTEKVLILE